MEERRGRRPVQRLGGGGGGVTNLSPFWEGTARKSPLPGTYLTKPWWNDFNLGQACRPCRGSCSPIPERGCFGDLPGDGTVVSPTSPIVEQLRRGWTSPGEERGDETGEKVVIKHQSVEICEATLIGLADQSKEFLYGRETDRDLRSA